MSFLKNLFGAKDNKPIMTGIEGRIKKAEAGDANEQFHLGLHYEQGQLGLPKDYFEAAKWYRKAGEQGHAGAQLYLGVYLCNVKQEAVEAYKWLELAKGGNDLDEVAAAELQAQLVAHMTPEQIAEGQKLANEFVPTVFGSWGIKPIIPHKK
jgi:TPR repeat protein